MDTNLFGYPVINPMIGRQLTLLTLPVIVPPTISTVASAMGRRGGQPWICWPN